MAACLTLALNGETMKTKRILPVVLLLAALLAPAPATAGDSNNPPAPVCDPLVMECPEGTTTTAAPDGGDSNNPPIVSLTDLVPVLISVLSSLP
jgi:hypothetical protein